ncbi:monovalent cation/H(+) antiporter subunit G [Natronospora cellulosivora (SeqCode)]
MLIREIIAYIFMSIGAIFAIITVIGLIRFPDVYTRIHAAAVVLTISAAFLTFGVAIYVWEFFLSLKIVLIGVFFLIANPMATHSIARASYRTKVAKLKVRTVDEYSDYLGSEDK